MECKSTLITQELTPVWFLSRPTSMFWGSSTILQDNGGRLGLEVFRGSCIQVTHREQGDTLLAHATLHVSENHVE